MQRMDGTLVARATARAYRAAGLFGGFFLLLGVVVTYENRGSWPVLVAAGGVAVLMLANLAYARLAIDAEGIRYRTLRTNRALKFSEIKRAYVEAAVNRSAPQGVATFWIQPTEGKRLNISLQTFPIAAVGAMLAALEQHGVPLDVPDTWVAQRMAREIRGLPGPRRVR